MRVGGRLNTSKFPGYATVCMFGGGIGKEK